MYVSVQGRGYNSMSLCPIRSSIRLSYQIDGHTNNPGVVWWCEDAGKLPVPGRLTNLDYNRPIVLPVGAVRGCLDIFLPSITSLFFFPFSGRRSGID